MAALFEITADILEAYDRLVDSDGEVNEENAAALEQLAAIQADKLASYYWCIKKAEAEAETAKAMAGEFHRKHNARQKAAGWLKNAVLAHLQSLGQSKAELPSGLAFGVQKNGGKRPVVTAGVTPYDMPLSPFVKTKTELSFDFDAIRAALDSGDPEAKAFADYGEPGYHLRLK